MRSRKLFLASAVLLVVGLTSLWSKWNGKAGINAGYPMDQWVVSFNGSVHGWPAMIGVVTLLAGIITFLIALLRVLME
jgi:hypothetical protein